MAQKKPKETRGKNAGTAFPTEEEVDQESHAGAGTASSPGATAIPVNVLRELLLALNQQQDDRDQSREDARAKAKLERKEEREKEKKEEKEQLEHERLLFEEEKREEREYQRRRHKEQDELNRGKSMPRLASFRDTEDLDINLESLEKQLDRYQVPQRFWVSHLLPLLDDDSISFHEGMPPEKKNDFAEVKRALLKHHGHGRGHYRSKWNDMKMETGTSHHQLGQTIRKVAAAWAKHEDDLMQWFTREKFLAMVDPDVRAWVITQNPHTLEQAMEQADLYRSGHPKDPDQPKSSEQATGWRHGGGENSGRRGKPWMDRPRARDTPQRRPADPGDNRSKFENKGERGDSRGTPVLNDLKPNEGQPLPSKRFGQGCFLCKDPGHIKALCPNKAKYQCNVLQSASTPQYCDSRVIYEGMLGDRAVQRILIDSGSTISMVNQRWIPTEYQRTGTCDLQGVHTTITLELTKVHIRVQGRSFFPIVAISPNLQFDVILGMNIQGLLGLLDDEEWAQNEWPSDEEIYQEGIDFQYGPCFIADLTPIPGRMNRQGKPQPASQAHAAGPQASSEPEEPEEPQEAEGEEDGEEESEEEQDPTGERSTPEHSSRPRRQNADRYYGEPWDSESEDAGEGDADRYERQPWSSDEEDGDRFAKEPWNSDEEESTSGDSNASERMERDEMRDPVEEDKESQAKSPTSRKQPTTKRSMTHKWGLRIPLEGGRDQLVDAQQKDESLQLCREKSKVTGGQFASQDGILIRR